MWFLCNPVTPSLFLAGYFFLYNLHPHGLICSTICLEVSSLGWQKCYQALSSYTWKKGMSLGIWGNSISCIHCFPSSLKITGFSSTIFPDSIYLVSSPSYFRAKNSKAKKQGLDTRLTSSYSVSNPHTYVFLFFWQLWTVVLWVIQPEAELVTLVEQHLDRQPPTVVIQDMTWWETTLAHVKLQERGLGVHLPVKVTTLYLAANIIY